MFHAGFFLLLVSKYSSLLGAFFGRNLKIRQKGDSWLGSPPGGLFALMFKHGKNEISNLLKMNTLVVSKNFYTKFLTRPCVHQLM